MGLVLPDNFIPIAEETGLIIPIGEWVLKNACMQVKKWQDAGHPTLRAAVNISVRQFKHQNFASTILRVLEEASLEPQYLDLEITESLLMKNTTQITGLLQEMHGMGVQITVDDFGAGYSNLGYFKHFPVDRLKVDKSLIRDIDASASSDAAIAAAIIAMGHSLDLDVIAEGVETQDQLGYLRSLWCDEVQGYLLSHPLDVEECNQFLSRA
jgi:EAL domain-containing protein (putative c-di-GMP-specific phosphodiesterase class I)